MKKFYLLTKTLLVMALLCVGASNAWAEAGDVTTNADIDFSNAIADGKVVGTVNSMTIGSGEIAKNGDAGWLSVYDATSTVTIPEAQRAGSKDKVNIKFKTAWGNKNKMGFGFNLKDKDGEPLAAFQFARWDGSATNSNTLNIDMTGLYGAHNSNKPIAGRYTLFDVTVDYQARTITSVVYCNNTDGKGATKTETFVASLTNTNPIATFNIFGYGVGGNTDRANIFDDLTIKTTEGDYSVTTYDYTVNWKCGDDIIKTATRQDVKDASISLLETDKAAFTEKGTKYFYVSDDASSKTVADDGSTVVTITIRKAENWNYTVNAVDESDNILGEITSGTVVEGESIYYYYPTFYKNGTDLLRADINDKTYGKGETPAGDNVAYTVTYKNVSISDVVFYKECEDIEGLTEVTAGNVPARCSNGKGAMASEATTVATLAPGKYKISGFAWGNSGTTFTLTAGETTVATFATAASTVNVTTCDEFTLSSTTDIVLGQQGNAGSSPKVIDFIYIQKIPESVPASIGEHGYATFSSKYALDFTSAGVEAYIATGGNETTVTMLKVEGTVAANTGLVLKGAAGNYNIPVVASGTAYNDNKLWAITSAETVKKAADGYTNYVLAKQNGKVVFASVTGENSASLPAGSAALCLQNSNSARAINLVFGGITGINEAAQATEAAQKDGKFVINGQLVIKKNGKMFNAAGAQMK